MLRGRDDEVTRKLLPQNIASTAPALRLGCQHRCDAVERLERLARDMIAEGYRRVELDNQRSSPTRYRRHCERSSLPASEWRARHGDCRGMFESPMPYWPPVRSAQFLGNHCIHSFTDSY